jgi:hypothetical protein
MEHDELIMAALLASVQGAPTVASAPPPSTTTALPAVASAPPPSTTTTLPAATLAVATTTDETLPVLTDSIFGPVPTDSMFDLGLYAPTADMEIGRASCRERV